MYDDVDDDLLNLNLLICPHTHGSSTPLPSLMLITTSTVDPPHTSLSTSSLYNTGTITITIILYYYITISNTILLCITISITASTADPPHTST